MKEGGDGAVWLENVRTATKQSGRSLRYCGGLIEPTLDFGELSSK